MTNLLARIEKALLGITSGMLASIVLLTLVQVFFRYVLNNALSWSAELTKIIFLWMTFLGSAVAMRGGRHLRIDTFVNLMSERNKLLVNLLVHLLMILLLAILISRGIDLSIRTINTVTGAMRLPRSVIFLPVPIGCSLMLIFAMEIIVNDFKSIFAFFRKTVK